MSYRGRVIAAIVFLVLAGAVFCSRTVFKAGKPLWDFSIYAESSRVYVAGKNPFDPAELERLWVADWSTTSGAPSRWLAPIAPPPTLLALAPFATLPRAVAGPVWMTVSIVLLLLAVAAAADLAGLRPGSPGWLCLFAATLLLGPAQSVIHAGQPAAPAIALAIIALWLHARPMRRAGDVPDESLNTTNANFTTMPTTSRSSHPFAAAMLLTIGIAFKSQLVLPFALFFLIHPPRRTGLFTLALTVAVVVVSFVPILTRDPAWMHDWLRNVRESSAPGQVNDFSTANPTRDHFVNLQMPFYAITASRTLANGLAIGCSSVLFVAWTLIYRLYRRGTEDASGSRRIDETPAALLPAAGLAAIVLLPIYHRYYDATFLLLPLAWAIGSVRTRQRPWAVATLLILAPFVLPVGWQTNLARHVPRVMEMTTHAWWRVGIMGLQSWLTLATAVVLLGAMHMRARRDRINSAQRSLADTSSLLHTT